MTDLVLERFWDNVKVDPITKCWNWFGIKNQKGYGRFFNYDKLYLSHRFAYEVNKGKIPEGLQIDHLCRNRLCCNPDHLEAVSCKENVNRGLSPMILRGIPKINANKTHCIKGHELKGDNLNKYALARGIRRCKKCDRENGRISRLKLRIQKND